MKLGFEIVSAAGTVGWIATELAQLLSWGPNESPAPIDQSHPLSVRVDNIRTTVAK